MHDGLKYLALIVLVGASITGFFFNKDILVWSANLSYFFQQNGGDLVPADRGTAAEQRLHILDTSGHRDLQPPEQQLERQSVPLPQVLHAINLGVLFKIIFYQGRPFLACLDIEGSRHLRSWHALLATRSCPSAATTPSTSS